MTKGQASNLVIITGAVLAGGTFLTHHYTTSTQHFAGEKQTFDLGKKLVAVGVSVIVLSILADQVPDFAGPLAALILVAYLTTHFDVFNEFAGTTDKKGSK